MVPAMSIENVGLGLLALVGALAALVATGSVFEAIGRLVERRP